MTTNDKINRRRRQAWGKVFGRHGTARMVDVQPRLDWLTLDHFRRLRARQWAERRALVGGTPR